METLRLAWRQRTRRPVVLDVRACDDDPTTTGHMNTLWLFGKRERVALVQVLTMHVGTIHEGHADEEGFVRELLGVDWHERVHAFLDAEGHADHRETGVRRVELVAALHLGWTGEGWEEDLRMHLNATRTPNQFAFEERPTLALVRAAYTPY